MNNPNPDILRTQAREKHLAGDTKAAILLLTQAISADRSNVNIALDMVQIFLDIGDLDAAENLFNRLGEKAQKTDVGLAIVSQLNFKKLAKNTRGMAVLQALVLQNPEDYQAHFDWAVCLFAEHEIEAGMDSLFLIVQNNPDFREGAAREMIGMICNMLAKTSPETSINYRRRLAGLLANNKH